MYLRAFIAFLALPGMVAGVIPALLVHAEGDRLAGWAFGFVFLGLGLVLLLWCIRDFFVAGRGTLAPWDPPKHLVVVGLYRLVRNPMYIAVVTMVFGWSMIAGSRLLSLYGVLLAVGFHLRVVISEEPWLHRQFGAEWLEYSASVARWLPRLRPWRNDKRT
jgi:protein-S-isoprenylcysteine O-methyltransferase Ste14